MKIRNVVLAAAVVAAAASSGGDQRVRPGKDQFFPVLLLPHRAVRPTPACPGPTATWTT